tara:strand:+ start:161 stop:997 length:837 start_codon:yes stop_codon:yes gene_type:complete
MDRIHVLVCDNKTVEKGFDKYVNKKSDQYENISVKKFKDRTRNELYRAMNHGVKYAKKKGYKIINFIQDDYQYLFKNDSHLDEVKDLFDKHKKIGQVNYNLVWRRKRKGIGKLDSFKVRGTRYMVMLQKRVVDNGFTRVSLYDKIGSYPTDAVSWGGDLKKGFDKHPGRYAGVENGEVWFGRECERRGYKRAISLFPNVGMMYDCAFVRGDIRMGNYFKPPNKYYLRPLAQKEIDDLRKRHDRRKFSFIEDLCHADGWKPATADKHSHLKRSISIYEH